MGHPEGSPPPRSAVVIGGGLAGIAAAVRLADHDVKVTLVETRKRLGGRATSFVDPTTGQVLDNCQHVLLRCCTNLLALYARLGVDQHIDWHRRLYFADAAGHLDVMEADDLPAPAHLGLSLLGMKQLTVRDKIAIARGMMAMLRTGVRGRARWHHISFADWLAQHHQTNGAVRKFWAPVTVGALNETPERMAADYAMQVFQEAFCASEKAYEMGLAKVPLVRLYDPAEAIIRSAGGNVRLGTSAAALHFDGAEITGLRLAGEDVLHADAYISALPFDRLDKLCTPAMRKTDGRLARLNDIEVSPIIGIHLFLDASRGPALDLPHVVLTESPLHWVFNKGCHTDAEGRPVQHLHGVISAAHDLVSSSAVELLALMQRELATVLPRAASAMMVHGQVVKEKRATFSLRPGFGELRPGPTGAIRNLYLAGDWCDTGWPATMEGAVRSGHRTACAALGQGDALPIPDLPMSPLVRLVSG